MQFFVKKRNIFRENRLFVLPVSFFSDPSRFFLLGIDFCLLIFIFCCSMRKGSVKGKRLRGSGPVSPGLVITCCGNFQVCCGQTPRPGPDGSKSGCIFKFAAKSAQGKKTSENREKSRFTIATGPLKAAHSLATV